MTTDRSFEQKLAGLHSIEVMTLRDWFAGQALIGILMGPKDEYSVFTVEERAYDRADRMLKARLQP